MTVHLRRLGIAGSLLVLGASLTVVPAAADPALLSLPAPTGGYRVGTMSVRLVDQSRLDPLAPSPRARELMVRVWYPARESRQPVALYQTLGVSTFYTGFLNATSGTRFPDDLLAFPTHSRENAPVAGARHPVVLFAPDSAGNGVDATGLHEELASRGYVVVGIDHTFDAGAVEFPGGRMEMRKPDLVEDDTLRAARVADVRFVLSSLGTLPHGLGRAVDPHRVAAVGHGTGGVSIVDAMASDRRIDTGVVLNGDPLGSATPASPVLLIGDQHHRRADSPDWAAFYDRQRGPRRHLVIDGTEHDDFSDITSFKTVVPPNPFLRTGSIAGGRALDIERVYLTAWLDNTLRGWPNPLVYTENPCYPEVDFQPDDATGA